MAKEPGNNNNSAPAHMTMMMLIWCICVSMDVCMYVWERQRFHTQDCAGSLLWTKSYRRCVNDATALGSTTRSERCAQDYMRMMMIIAPIYVLVCVRKYTERRWRCARRTATRHVGSKEHLCIKWNEMYAAYSALSLSTSRVWAWVAIIRTFFFMSQPPNVWMFSRMWRADAHVHACMDECTRWRRFLYKTHLVFSFVRSYFWGPKECGWDKASSRAREFLCRLSCV